MPLRRLIRSYVEFEGALAQISAIEPDVPLHEIKNAAKRLHRECVKRHLLSYSHADIGGMIFRAISEGSSFREARMKVEVRLTRDAFLKRQGFNV